MILAEVSRRRVTAQGERGTEKLAGWCRCGVQIVYAANAERWFCFVRESMEAIAELEAKIPMIANATGFSLGCFSVKGQRTDDC